jgi:hypothetical protein
MTHNQRRGGLAESSRVSICLVMRRISVERNSLAVASVSPMLDVVLSPPEVSRALSVAFD